jgi:hypothetical protein
VEPRVGAKRVEASVHGHRAHQPVASLGVCALKTRDRALDVAKREVNRRHEGLRHIFPALNSVELSHDLQRL